MHLIADRQRQAAAQLRFEAARRERRTAGLVFAAAGACFVALALPCLLGQVYVADDLGEFHLPLRAFYSQQLAAGEPFDWLPELFGGFYVTGEGQLGAYHPLHLLLYRWFPLPLAFDLELLASYPLLFAGTYVLLRMWLARRDAAAFGSLAFSFGSFSLLHFVHPNAIAIVAHLPWLLVAVEMALVQPRGPRRATAQLAVGLLIASQLLLGYPQYVWLSLLTVAAYAIWRASALHVPLVRLAALTLFVGLGIVAAAVQWLPTLDALQHSTRSDSNGDFANSGALHPLNLLQLVAPYLFQTRVAGQNTHELGMYLGAVPLMLCVWLLTQRRRWGQYAPVVWAALAFGGASLLYAFGSAGGVYRIQQLLPVVGHFRFPCRAIVLVQLTAAVCAAVAFALLREAHGSLAADERRRGDRALLIVATLSVGFAALAPLFWTEFIAPAPLVWAGPALIVAAAGLVALSVRNVRGTWIALVLLTAVDLTTYGLSYSVWQRTKTLDDFIATVSLPPSGRGTRVAAPDVDGLRTGDRMLLAGLARIDGYAGLEPAKRLNYTQHAALQLAGVSYVRLPATADGGTAVRWQSVGPTAPRLRLATRIVPFDAAAAAFDKTEAALDEPLTLSPSQPGTARMVVDKPGELGIDCDLPTRQVLVTTESFHAGWRASIDGVAAPVVRVDGDFLGCVVEPGAHRVTFQFRPLSLLVGEYLSACGLGLLLLTFAISARRAPRARG
ncbi:MAG: hypothetical protein AB7U73_00420 [Pirellulales bacterium]